jgi:hypothetical protein
VIAANSSKPTPIMAAATSHPKAISRLAFHHSVIQFIALVFTEQFTDPEERLYRSNDQCEKQDEGAYLGLELAHR